MWRIVDFLFYMVTALTGIEMFKKILDKAEAGDQLGALLRGVKRDEVKRGCIAAPPGTISMHNCFQAQVGFMCNQTHHILVSSPQCIIKRPVRDAYLFSPKFD